MYLSFVAFYQTILIRQLTLQIKYLMPRGLKGASSLRRLGLQAVVTVLQDRRLQAKTSEVVEHFRSLGFLREKSKKINECTHEGSPPLGSLTFRFRSSSARRTSLT